MVFQLATLYLGTWTLGARAYDPYPKTSRDAGPAIQRGQHLHRRDEKRTLPGLVAVDCRFPGPKRPLQH